MHSLEVIISLNKRASKPKPTHLNRELSICRSRGGLVLHSANLRSTAFVSDRKEVGVIVRAFAACRSHKSRNKLVDRYFS